MIKDFLCKLFDLQPIPELPPVAKHVVVPLELEETPEWENGDRVALNHLLFKTALGLKFRKVLYYEVTADALRPVLLDDYRQGIRHGKNAMLGRILNLSEVDEDTENEEGLPAQ